jgi:hypothetical protein
MPADPVQPVSRRRFLSASGALAAGGSAALLAACRDESDVETDDAGDARIVNRVLARQQRTAAAYAALAPRLRGVAEAQQFQTQNQAQADGLAKVVGELGGQPVAAKSEAAYASETGAGSVKDRAAAIALLIEIQSESIAEFERTVPKLVNTDLRATVTQLAVHQAQQVAVLVGIETGNDPAKQAPEAFVTGMPA